MKVFESKEDRCGRYPLWFSGASLSQIHDYLFRNYQGYKFCIIFDTSKDEYEEFETPVPVYFADEALPELAEFYDYELKKKR